jgi:hypothetical protein
VEESEFLSRVQSGLGGADLWRLRQETAMAAAVAVGEVGSALIRHAVLNEKADDVRAMGYVLQMAGELGVAAVRLFSERQHYAGAALVRQIVEIEYLTWTFREGKESVGAWFNSTHEERRKSFSPVQLRKNAKGRFLDKDYRNHCEQGGHPVPAGIPFLGGENPQLVQLMLVDMIAHLWRTWDQVRRWLDNRTSGEEVLIPVGAANISFRLADWGRVDPWYALMVERHPEPSDAR